MAVGVVLLRAIAVVADAVIVRRERKEHRKVRHRGHPIRRFVVQCDIHRARRVHRIRDRAMGDGGCRKRIGKAHGDARGTPLSCSRLAEITVNDGERRIVRAPRDLRAAAVETRELPLRGIRRRMTAVVVVRRRTPETRLWQFLDQLASAIAVGDEISLRTREHEGKARPLHAEVDVAHDDAQISAAGKRHAVWCGITAPENIKEARCRSCGRHDDRLSKGDLIVGRCPQLLIPQAERCRQHVLPRAEIRHLVGCRINELRLSGCHRMSQLPRLPDLSPVEEKRHPQLIVIRIGEEALVFDLHPVPCRAQGEVLIVILHLLQLRRRSAVGKENAVAAEIVVRRTVAKVAAVEEHLLPIASAPTDRLIAEVPDKAALIERLALGQLRVLVHAAAAVAHRMRVLTRDKGLVPMLLQKGLDVRRLRIHLALHIARHRIAAIPENSLVVHESRGVSTAEELTHLVDIAPAAGLIAARPDQDARMVLVALVHRLCTVEHGGQPFRMIARQTVRILFTRAVPHPRAMCLEIRLVDHIEAVKIRELIEAAAVRVM